MASDFEAQVRATNDKINARTGRPLIRAIAVGLILGGALLVSLGTDSLHRSDVGCIGSVSHDSNRGLLRTAKWRR